MYSVSWSRRKGYTGIDSGFKKPDTFPNFTQCDQTTPEMDSDWKAVIVHGGPFRGFSQIMPSFGEALRDDQIDKVIRYLRGFCTNSHWPRGELNLPRALITEKAYPEDEVVTTTTFNAQGAPGVMNETVYEQRFGVKNQIEVTIPFTFQDQNHAWYGGIGDSAIALKREIFSSLRSGSIFSLNGEVAFPTGNKARGLGTGTTTFEMFAAYGQLLPANFFLQFQGGAELPAHTDVAPQALFWNTVVGQSFARNKGLLCATCHTLITVARGPGRKEIGELNEQMPYPEWLHSDYRDKQSCQDCHMPKVEEQTPISKVLSVPRQGLHQHVFVAAEFFMRRMLNRYRDDLSVEALPQELTAAADQTVAFCRRKLCASASSK